MAWYSLIVGSDEEDKNISEGRLLSELMKLQDTEWVGISIWKLSQERNFLWNFKILDNYMAVKDIQD